MASCFRVFRSVALLAVLAFGIGVSLLPTQAAHDRDEPTTPNGHRLELLVFESEACAYCEIFRRDVAPGYRFAPLAAVAPLRFVDIAKVDLDKIGLASRLNILPTTVLMKNGREVERIPGLTGANTYYFLLKYMISKNE
jgi:thioredoxin-related protein